MDKTGTTYRSLDDARAELVRRWSNVELRKAVATELGPRFWLECYDRPIGFISQPLLSPGNGFMYFYQAARYVGAVPFAGEFLGDFFSYKNEEKCGLGQLRVTEGEQRLIIDIVQARKNDRKRICDIVTHTGESLVDFHHRLFELTGYKVARRDMTEWYHGIGKPADYYYPYLLHFVAHGVLFETFQTEEADEQENIFTQTVVLPAIGQIEERFGLKPLIVRLYPANQTADEDFFWWCYPPKVNDYIVQYAKENKLPVRSWSPQRGE